jgi:hypothetical protein
MALPTDTIQHDTSGQELYQFGPPNKADGGGLLALLPPQQSDFSRHRARLHTCPNKITCLTPKPHHRLYRFCTGDHYAKGKSIRDER